ncbi:transporter substrate-binding domain-containing protein [Vibrio aestuarianus]|uniref:Transporter substrate-binding domain-containing protein n=1 Tax=Vibrio aestuarianus TaxID=28171 RepID=A0A9X4F9T6_9VIBR|nr:MULTISPECIES: transporter substrate-binding domain-containing protein [Vibrio]MDE1235915.1 transporter substrate-binding domain-containing protein [Vibrio aestuarianus]MDE1246793.1 transporter substrate-binding domain-containing protein [Vibrio aestuarianus]MDE1325796.1 transporter substrate-binding domain-containing protein [Vibrio aestuarianus]MDE1333445.1 transporter substrate-binding domain-containing protein [Vibrio aestuarianus]MDE1347033.1 transporter substrate-binding domain-contain
MAERYLYKFLLMMWLNSIWAFPSYGKISFATFEFAPYTTIGEQGQLTGPFVDIVKEVCNRMENECDIRYWPQRRAKQLVNSGQSIAIFPIGWNEERMSTYYFSAPIVVSEYGFFIRKDFSTSLDVLKNLQNLKVMVFSPSNTYSSLLTLQEKLTNSGYEPMDIVKKTDATLSILHMLNMRRVDAYYSNRDVGQFKIQTLNLDNIVYGWGYQEVVYFVAFPKEHVTQELVRRFNQALLGFMVNNPLFLEILSTYRLSPSPMSEKILDMYGVIR